jgi:hypothetical protein
MSVEAPVGGPFATVAAQTPELSLARKAAAQKAARAAAARKVRAALLVRARRLAARKAAQARLAKPNPIAPYDWNNPQANSFGAFNSSFGNAAAPKTSAAPKMPAAPKTAVATKTAAAPKTLAATKRAAAPSVGLPSCAQNQLAGCR